VTVAKKQRTLTYKAIGEDQGGNPFSASIYSNRDVVGIVAGKLIEERLNPGVNLTDEEQVKTEVMRLYHPKSISLLKCF